MSLESLPATVEVLRKQGLTLPRNPILIKIFRVLKLAENAGYGFDKMFDGWKSYYKIEPNVENEITFYKIEFPLKTRWDKDLESDQKIINLLKENKEITIEEIAKNLNLTTRAIDKSISKLKEKGILRRVGPDKGGYWEVIDMNKRRKNNNGVKKDE